MKQYYGIKEKHPDAILLFRVGDFYETFEEDAVRAAEILGITLTKRANGAASYVDLAGFPYHALETYLPKLVRAGQRVAVCEQLEDPKQTKTIVKRGITELVTPGVSINDNILEHKENNFLASVFISKKMAGVSFLDISTGEFLTSEGSFDYVDKLLQSLKPKEVLVDKRNQKVFIENFGSKFYVFPLEDWIFTETAANDRLLRHFEVKNLKGFGVGDLKLGTIASGAILHYMDITQHEHIKHVNKLSRIDEDKYVWLDRFTIRNLELFNSMHEGGRALIDVLDRTVTPMGARRMKRWLALPLKNIPQIQERQSVVGYFLRQEAFSENIEAQLRIVGDLERLVSKVAVGRITPRELVQLKNSLSAIIPIKKECGDASDEKLNTYADLLNPCDIIRNRIDKEIRNDAPNLISKGNIIQSGVSAELDDLRDIATSGKDYLVGIQQREIEKTGITSLKIGYNNVFGYYIEVRNTHKDKVPEEWIRKQTLVNAERYITEELKEYEAKILGAEEKILSLETNLFNDLVFALIDFIQTIQNDAVIISEIDCLLSFARVANANSYVCPHLNETTTIDIKKGRHPVIESLLPLGEEYVPNDVFLNNDDQQIMIITGPNMVGKSALLRQTALIVLMAQMGSFVPAVSAELGYIDKVFTRVGASDNISLGESTFMVEMSEAASILNNLSDRSLILLDEIGRGTSTYDGISIAWAIVEFIHEHSHAKAKTMFATHYHELNEMEKSFDGIKNYHVSVREVNNKVIFIRKLERGGTEHSFGIHVARMAGMPKSVVKRANKILEQLEKSHIKNSLAKPVADLASTREGFQLSFFQLEDPVLKDIRDEIVSIDINNLTPIEALNKLSEIKRIAGLKSN